MPVKRFLAHSNSFQTAEHVLDKIDEIQDLAPEAREVIEDMVESLGFERRDVAAKKEDKQHVLYGQLLVLGDARNGKTSLVKAMTGEKFDANEDKTKGVEFKYVNREWKTLGLQNVAFGNFDRFSETVDFENALWPRIFNQGRYRFKSGVMFGKEIIFDNYVFKFLQHYFGHNMFFCPLFLSIICYTLIIPIILGAIFGESCGRWLLYGLQRLDYLYNLMTTKKNHVSVIMLLIFYFDRLGTNLSLWKFGCSEDPIPMRFSSYFGRLLERGWPLYTLNPIIFLILKLFSSCISFFPLVLFHLIFDNCPWPLQLDFLLDFQEEIYLPLMMLVRYFFFFAPIGLSCSRTSIAFPLDCCFIFALHLILLYHQNILFEYFTVAALAFEAAIIFPLCVTGLNNVIHIILMNIMLLCVGAALHIYGRWLEVKSDFNGKTFSQVFFHKDFIIYSIKIRKALLNVQKLKNALDKAFCKLKLKVLDFAGDEEYYAYHQIFLNSHALYVIVFNIQQYIKDNFKDIESKVARLRFWMESIHSHVPQGTPVFLVGTHRADTQIDTLRKVNSWISNAIGHSFIDEIVFNDKDDLLFFHVENSRGLFDKGIISLRRKIRSVAQDEFKSVLGQQIPLSWIKVQDAIIQYIEHSQGPVCITVEDFKKRFGHLYIEWSDEMLKYFHKKGLIIYIDKDERLSRWVLLNPDVLVQIVILLISQPKELTNERGFRRHWMLLKKTGMITKGLLHFVLSQAIGEQESEDSSLITFLEEYDLICPLKYPCHAMQSIPAIKQTTHFVPSLLPMSESNPVWNESSEDIKFYIFFDNCLPDALFYRLLSRACKLSYEELGSYEPTIYRECGVFWASSQQSYCLRLMKNEGQVEVTLSRSRAFLEPRDILILIGNMVEEICKRDFQNLSFHCGPECSSPICPGSRSDSTSWLTGQPRRHVYNIYPACKGGRRLLEPFKCQNVCQEREAKIWLPSNSS